MNKPLTIMFKPTTRCNLRCHYCYADREQEYFAGAMSLEEAHGAFDWVLRFCKECEIKAVTVLWHGGEPLLMGAKFIDDCVTYYERLFTENSIKVRNHIQTNLTLAKGELIPLLAKKFRVGFSFDYNSPHRIFPDGTDASDVILDRYAALKENGIQASAICLMTAENRNDIPGLYRFFKLHGIPFRLNRMFHTSSDRTTDLASTVSAKEYAKGVCELIDTWLDDASPFGGATTAAIAINHYLTNESCLCFADEGCARSFLCIAPGGVVLPCGRFEPDTWAIGNWKVDTPSQVLANKLKFAKVAGSKSIKRKCQNCKWDSFCTANCMYFLLTGGSEDECVATRIIWEHVESRMSAMGLERGVLARLSKEEASKLLISVFGETGIDA